MPHIDIHIERPWLTLGLVGAIVWFVMHGAASTQATVAMGGDEHAVGQPEVIAQEATDQMSRLRDEQQVLLKREEILRGQLSLLEEQINQGDSVDMQSYLTTRDELTALLQDKAAAEAKIIETLHEYWAAEGYAYDASSRNDHTVGDVSFVWPVDPALGLSAHFDDAGYAKRFGMPHHAIDIPVSQGSVVGAAADGVVAKVSDQGMGFNSLVIRHANGYSTLYGHVSQFLVTEGETVHAGDPVALSGGTPGTKGAGLMTTGAHLHLAVYKDGVVVDPLPLLPFDSNAR